MDEVAPELYVGTLEDAEDATGLENTSVDRVVSLTYTDPEIGFPGSVSKFAMLDGPRNDRQTFRAAVQETLESLRRGETILVHCSRGASRSPSVAAAAIAMHEEITIEEAFEQIGQRRDEIDPHPALVQQAVDVYRAYHDS